MFFGKVIGGLIGLAAAGILGLVLGLFLGHAFDRALAKALRFGTPENIARINDNFFATTFLLSGYLAKVDGHISPSEINHTEQIIAKMGLAADQRVRAIELFRQGAAADFNMEQVVATFLQTCGAQLQMQRTLLLFLISLAHADQGMVPAEHDALVRIANVMGIGAAQLELLLRMARAQEQFQGRSGPEAPRGSSLANAYSALGVDSTISDKELKRAYRRLMSENHPDKLIAKGVPEAMIKLATARAQEIQSAYEMIKKSRPAMR